MKLIKTYSALAIANWVLIALLVQGRQFIIPVQKTPSPPVSAQTQTPPDTQSEPTPTARVIHVPRVIVVGNDGSVSAGVTGAASQQQTNTNPVATQAPAQATQPTKDTRCLIVIDGATYDVSAFRSMHSGGDIFQCGTDMSSVFWSQHGSSTLRQMARYRL